MGTNKLKNVTFFLEVAYMFIFGIQLFFYISRHSFGVHKNYIFATIKCMPLHFLGTRRNIFQEPVSKTEVQTVFVLLRPLYAIYLWHSKY